MKYKPGDRVIFRMLYDVPNRRGEIVRFECKTSDGEIYVTKWNGIPMPISFTEHQLIPLEDPNDLMKEIL